MAISTNHAIRMARERIAERPQGENVRIPVEPLERLIYAAETCRTALKKANQPRCDAERLLTDYGKCLLAHDAPETIEAGDAPWKALLTFRRGLDEAARRLARGLPAMMPKAVETAVDEDDEGG